MLKIFHQNQELNGANVKKCAKCGMTKTASEFSTDNSRPDKLTSYCKDCSRERAMVWKMENDPPKNTYNDDSLSLFEDAIIEFMTERHKIQSLREYEYLMTDAKDYAFSVVPSLVQPYEDYRLWFGINGKSVDLLKGGPQTEMEKLGFRVHGIIARLSGKKGYKRLYNIKEEKMEVESGYVARVPSSAQAYYARWVEKNDFVADDNQLAYFFKDITSAAFASARGTLKGLGYEFKQVQFGWMVTARPKVESASNDNRLSDALKDMSKEDVIALLKKLL